MVNEIRIYFEGGGDQKVLKDNLRRGFHRFLQPLIEIAREKGVRWSLIACGSRNETYRNFRLAMGIHRESFNVLLVDSEDPVALPSAWEHLRDRDRWDLTQADEENCHLMVQLMESWFVSDRETLQDYYGQGFLSGSLPNNPDIERVTKARIEEALRRSTTRTQKGEYSKARHSPDLLEQTDSEIVRRASAYCDRLFTLLAEKMNSTL